VKKLKENMMHEMFLTFSYLYIYKKQFYKFLHFSFIKPYRVVQKGLMLKQ